MAHEYLFDVKLLASIRVKANSEAEARAHCSDPQTSSTTCTLPRLVALTRVMGPWMDTYSIHPKFRKAMEG